MESLGSVVKRNIHLYTKPRKKGAKANFLLLARAMAIGR
jgi:hypothetical protein